MRSQIKKVITFVREYVSNPILIMFSVFVYLVREVLFGSKNSINYLRGLSQTTIVPILRMRGAEIGEGTVIQEGIIFHNCRDFRNLNIGVNCHVGKGCLIDLRDKVTIENNTVIAMNCQLITHIDMTNSPLSDRFPAKHLPITVGSGVYVGASTTVLMGVEIDSNSIVGANSLVNKSIDPGAVYVGSPVKKVKNINGFC